MIATIQGVDPSAFYEAKEIILAYAMAEPWIYYGGIRVCGSCAVDEPLEHDADCNWRLANEWLRDNGFGLELKLKH